MNSWINGIALSSIISTSIDYYDTNLKKIKVGFKNGKPDLETFSKTNKHHVNILIGEIIDDIEYVIRFVLEKYSNTYHTIISDILGEENSGVNWAAFLEYGTKDSVIIALQNYGLSRHSAFHLDKNYRSCLTII